MTDELWDGEGPVPVYRDPWLGLIPSLPRIRRERWAQVLLPCTHHVRVRAAYSVYLSAEEREAASALVDSLGPPPADVAARAGGRSPGIPVARPAISRQLNVRIAATDYRDLATAADIVGTTPTTLARMLILNGARRMLVDHAAAYVAVKDPHGAGRRPDPD